jgi:hypothetical protein
MVHRNTISKGRDFEVNDLNSIPGNWICHVTSTDLLCVVASSDFIWRCRAKNLRSHTSHLHCFVAVFRQKGKLPDSGASCRCVFELCLQYFRSCCIQHLPYNTTKECVVGGQIYRKILSFCSTVAEEFVLLGYETVSVGNLIPTFRHMSPPARARNLQEGKIM